MSSPAPRRVGRWVVALVVLVGAVGAWLVHLGAGQASPYLMASAANPAAPPRTSREAAERVLAFVPAAVNSTGVGQSVGRPVGKAILLATGNPPSAIHVLVVRARHQAGGWWVQVTAPVDVQRLAASGEIHTGFFPGASDPARGRLNVHLADGTVFGIRFSPQSGRATFQFLLSTRGQSLESLNWNASAVLAQTDASDTLSGP
jgi:hypothetical protein